MKAVGVAGGIGAAVVGFVAVRALGLNALIPAFSVALCWSACWLLGVRKRLAPPVAFTAGHGLWFAVGIVLTGISGGSVANALVSVGPDIVVIAVVTAWIVSSGSRVSLYGLVVYQMISLGLNVLSFKTMGDNPWQAVMLVHMALRIAAIVGALLALAHFDEAETDDEEAAKSRA